MGEERISGACELRRILQRTKKKKKKFKDILVARAARHKRKNC
jgi:hypothetical protein